MSTSFEQSIVHWEEAGASLASMLANYHNLSSTLMNNTCLQMARGSSRGGLVDRIDKSLGTLHTTLYQQLSQTRVALTKTRNRLISAIYCLPDEILFEIFLNVIFTLKTTGLKKRDPEMDDRVRAIYHNLYNLFGVSTVWRDICLSRPILWSLVPMTDSLGAIWRPSLAELSLQRSGLHDLNFAIGSRNGISFDQMRKLKDISKHLARTRTLNLHSESLREIRNILNLVFLHCVPEHMTQLSLRLLPQGEYIDYGTSERHVLNHRNSPLHRYVTTVIRSLSSLRISNICLEWTPTMFSTRLVELRVDLIKFPGNSAISAFSAALSSAHELRDLKVISLEAFADQGPVLPQALQISLPKLQSLYLEDLYFNFTSFLLTSITPVSYRLNFNTTTKTALNLLANSVTSNVNLEDIYTLLARFPTHKLILSSSEISAWITQSGLCNLLKSMPTLRTLIINNCDLDQELLKGLQSPRGTHDSTFPELETIEFRGCYASDKILGLKDVVNNHPIRRLILGLSRVGPPITHRLGEEDEIIRWLRDTVPSFQFEAHNDLAPESTDILWRLWEL